MYQVKLLEEIKRDILEALQSDLEKLEGGFADTMAGPVALELHRFYEALNQIRAMVWVDESSGPYLDLAADELRIEPRKPGTKAQAALTITGTPGYLLPAGSTFLTGEGELFDTLTDCIIPEEGEADVLAEARELGAQGNVDAGTIVHRFSNDTRVKSVTNRDPAIGGSEPESDQSLYDRIVFARQRPSTSGNKYHYEMWALESSGVSKARVFPLWNGPGTVKVLIADQHSQPVDEAVVERCAAHIEEQRPTTARVTVVSASERKIDISATVQLEAGADRDEVREQILQQFEAHFRHIALEQFVISYHWMGAMLIAAEGVRDYRNMRIDGSRDNIALTQEEVPVLGEVEITWT